MDVGSTLPGYALAGNGRWSTSGVSTNISIHYIAAAPVRLSSSLSRIVGIDGWFVVGRWERD